jgi:hypothetical protein
LRIEERLSQVRPLARQQRVFGGLQPISSAPSLRTLNGFGFRVYGRSDYDADTRSYVTTYYFVALFIPLFPLARYRVIDSGGNRFNFLGRLPLRKLDRWHLAVAAVMTIAAIVALARSSDPFSAPPGVSVSRASQLSDLKARIDSIRAQVAVVESRMQPVIGEIRDLDDQLAHMAADLKVLDDRNKAGFPIDIDAYNSKVQVQNQLLARRIALLAANHDDVQTYNGLIAQDTALVSEYNDLLKAGGS